MPLKCLSKYLDGLSELYSRRVPLLYFCARLASYIRDNGKNANQRGVRTGEHAIMQNWTFIMGLIYVKATPPIYLHLIFDIIWFEISSLMN